MKLNTLSVLLAASTLVTLSTLSFQQPVNAAAAEIVPGVTREMITVPFTYGAGNRSTYQLEAMLVRSTSGQLPLAIISHGSPRTTDDRTTYTPSTSTAIAIEFARRGYATLVLMRRGYGESEGPWSEGYGSCSDPNYEAAGRATSADIRAAIRYVTDRNDLFTRGRTGIDTSRVLLVGVSAGGFGSIAAAADQLPGLIGVLNFAGGRGSQNANDVCSQSRLIAAYGSYGRTSQVPTQWLYAANDQFFSPALGKQMLAAFQKNGGTGEFVTSPAFSTDGHAQFSEPGIPNWRRDVDRFLRVHQLPNWTTPIADTVPNIAPPSSLSTSGRADFQKYLASNNFNKAFAVNPRGGYGWRTGRRTAQDAADDALDACGAKNSGCVIYAADNHLANRVR